MRLRSLLPYLAFLALSTSALGQDKSADVLVDGDPPLTAQMARDYMSFMQWSLRTPLTLGQEDKIKTFLVDNWKASNTAEITRTLNILELRKQIERMGLKDERWAAFQTGADALRNWRKNQNLEMSRLGLGLYNSSHTGLIKGWPTIYRQTQDALEEMGYFIIGEVDGTPPPKIDAVERVQFADALAKVHPSLSQDQKMNLLDIPKVWIQLRNSWPTLDDATKTSLRNMWKAGFNPPKPPPAKGEKAKATPPSTRQQPALNRLVKLTWLTNPDVFAKMKSIGTPYGIGW